MAGLRQRAEKEKKEIVDVVQVRRWENDAISVPEEMTLAEAIKVLQRQEKYEEETVEISETIPVFPWDGALALQTTLEQRFGVVFHEGIPDFFGNKGNAQLIAVEVAPGKTQKVPWGTFLIPGAKGTDYLQTSTGIHEGMLCFQLQAKVRRKFEGLVTEIATKTRALAAEKSIYKSQAIRIKFYEDIGSGRHQKIGLPTPRFLDLSKIDLGSTIFKHELELAIQTNVWTPLRHPEECRSIGVPLKRGILLVGEYGCGKTLLAHDTAKVATESGWTYIYLENVAELPDAMNFAKHYSPAVVFAEDIDRIVTGERTEEMDKILNTIDGVDSKDAEIMVVLTSNHLANIHTSLLRPGRLDVVLHIAPPDAHAVERLLRSYGHSLIPQDEDLTIVAQDLSGQIPAVIREVVERAKLEAVRRTGRTPSEILAQDLASAAFTMTQQRDLLEANRHVPPLSPEELLARSVARLAGAAEVFVTTDGEGDRHTPGSREPGKEHAPSPSGARK